MTRMTDLALPFAAVASALTYIAGGVVKLNQIYKDSRLKIYKDRYG